MNHYMYLKLYIRQAQWLVNPILETKICIAFCLEKDCVGYDCATFIHSLEKKLGVNQWVKRETLVVIK